MTGCSVVSSNSVEIAPEINEYVDVLINDQAVFTFKATDIPRILSNRNLEAETNAKEGDFILSRAFCSEQHSFRATLTKSSRHENASAFPISTLPLNNVSRRTEPQPLPSKRHDTRRHFPRHIEVQGALHSPTDELLVWEYSISEIPYSDLQSSSTA